VNHAVLLGLVIHGDQRLHLDVVATGAAALARGEDGLKPSHVVLRIWVRCDRILAANCKELVPRNDSNWLNHAGDLPAKRRRFAAQRAPGPP